MRRAAKIDANQPIIVDTFRKLGCGVVLLHAVGKGMTDLLVEIGGFNILVEVKDGEKPRWERKLTPAQVKFHAEWRGHKVIIKSEEQAIQLVAIVRLWRIDCPPGRITLDTLSEDALSL